MKQINSGRNSSSSKKLIFLYRGGREKRLAGALKGKCPADFFFGAIDLIKQKCDVSIVDINYTISSVDQGIVAKLLDLLFRNDFLPSRVYGPLLESVWKKLPRFITGDVIVATTPGIAFAVAILKMLYQFPARIIAIQTGLTHHKFSKRRLFINRLFLKRMSNIVYLDAERKRMLEKYELSSKSVAVNQFGVDTSFWHIPDKGNGKYVFALGNDSNRDYKLLLRAAEQIKSKFIIVTSREIVHNIPENVTIFKSNWIENRLTDEDIRDLYGGARIVVVPLRQTSQPSGQSVCLQAMSCGCPVVYSSISGLWSDKILRDDETVILTNPENLSDLTKKIKELLRDKQKCQRIGSAARQAVVRYANTDSYASLLKSLMDE